MSKFKFGDNVQVTRFDYHCPSAGGYMRRSGQFLADKWRRGKYYGKNIDPTVPLVGKIVYSGKDALGNIRYVVEDNTGHLFVMREEGIRLV